MHWVGGGGAVLAYQEKLFIKTNVNDLGPPPPPPPPLLLLLLSSLNTAFFGWLAAVFLKHQVTARDLRCPRICEGFWPYPVSTLSAMNPNDMKHQSLLTTFLYLSRQSLMSQLCLVPQLLCAISRSVSTPA